MVHVSIKRDMNQEKVSIGIDIKYYVRETILYSRIHGIIFPDEQ